MDRDRIVTRLDKDEIQALIPHRDPFLLLDCAVDVVPDTRATGIKQLTGNEYFFRGHFPGHPVMPAVLIIEAMAQTAAVLGGCTIATDCRTLMFFTGVDRARFRLPVVPGDTLEVHVKKHRRHASVWQFLGEARVKEKLVADVAFTAVVMGRVGVLGIPGGSLDRSTDPGEACRPAVATL
jgi:3-hydroxyacyl-[acyl-carrier-protein] dehydratase